MPTVTFDDNRNRIQINRDEIEGGIRDALSGRPDAETWNITHMVRLAENTYLFHIRVTANGTTTKLPSLELPTDDIEQAARGPRAEMAAVYGNWVHRHLRQE